MIAYGVATIFLDRFANATDIDDADRSNVQNPNDDVISDQMTVMARVPSDTEEVLLLANLLGNSGRLNEAIPLYEQVLRMHPEDSEARVDFARALADGGYDGDAELQFEIAIQGEPGNQVAHFYLAELYRLSQPPRVADAIIEYRAASELDPTSFVGQQAQEILQQFGSATPSITGSATPAVEVTATP